MRTHDDRAGGAGGYPDDRYGAGAPAQGQTGQAGPVSAFPQGPAGTQAYGTRSYDYYDDDDGYSDFDSTSMIEPDTGDYYDDPGRGRRELGWNGGADLGLLVMRLALGTVFLAHGAQKLFGVLGGPGSEGFAQALQGYGYRNGGSLALLTGATEFGAGALLVLGLFTPLAAAGVLGVMVNAVLLKLGNGFFASGGGAEYEVVLGALALGLMFAGPGRVALDNGRAWFRRPLLSGFICLLISAGASAAVLLLSR